jgi:hypothetical protein
MEWKRSKLALKDIKTVHPAFLRCEKTMFCPSIESEGCKM